MERLDRQMQKALAKAVAYSKPSTPCSHDPSLRVKDLERHVARLEEQLNSQGALLATYQAKEASSYSHGKELKVRLQEMQSQLKQVRSERDQVIGEKYVLQAQLKASSQNEAAAATCRELEGKLVETKLESAHLKMEIDNLKDELESTQGLLVFRNKEFENLSKELNKVIKQRDLVLERYQQPKTTTTSSRNSDTKSARKPPAVLPKTAVKPHFTKGVFDIGLSSSRAGSLNSSMIDERSISSIKGRDLKFE